jgi:simple sugar transport system substrate-binding protein
MKAAFSGKWQSKWVWLGPDWKNINNPDTSTVGYVAGPALPPSAQKHLDGFIKDLGSGKINLFKGPLNYQDGSPFVKAGQSASDKQVWYMEQLLQGIDGQSSAK